MKGWHGIFFFLQCCVLVVQAQHGNLLAAHRKGSNELESEFRSREQGNLVRGVNGIILEQGKSQYCHIIPIVP